MVFQTIPSPWILSTTHYSKFPFVREANQRIEGLDLLPD